LVAALDGDLSDEATLAAVIVELRQSSVLEETLALAAQYAAAAAAELEALPPSPEREALRAIAQAAARRPT
jgi:heptaprenyl diphosphate synthase